MILKYQKTATIRLGLGFGLLFFAVIFYGATFHSRYEDLGQFCCVVLTIFGYLIFVLGCADLLKAKGHSSAVALPFFLAAFCCCLPFILIAPPFILFGLEDKTKRRHH